VKHTLTSYFKVLHPGILSTVQDLGRYGQSHLGLTSGGPADMQAYLWANRLLNNPENCPVLEVNFGGLKLIATTATTIAVTGAKAPLTINGQVKEIWRSHHVNADDEIEIGYATEGCRVYLAVFEGFVVEPQFSSVSTVIREKVGGVNGEALKAEDVLFYKPTPRQTLYALKTKDIPRYENTLTLHVVTGYQYALFDRVELAKFFCNEYQVSAQCDRMGYRLNGPAIQSGISQLLSEGICKGAIQIPPDGQPIILSVDRQTIGGYPKLGSVLSLDLDLVMQANQGAKIHFEPISIHYAHTVLHLAKAKYAETKLIKVTQ
tara:strand:- start:395877 stop:396833 length:957 start_codon:yes stop_codon:yes gene_type:complete